MLQAVSETDLLKNEKKLLPNTVSLMPLQAPNAIIDGIFPWPTWRGGLDRILIWHVMPLTSWDNGVSTGGSNDCVATLENWNILAEPKGYLNSYLGSSNRNLRLRKGTLSSYYSTSALRLITKNPPSATFCLWLLPTVWKYFFVNHVLLGPLLLPTWSAKLY